MSDTHRPSAGWRLGLHEVIFEADTPVGKAFDVALLAAIVASVVVVMLDSVVSINARYGELLYALEWLFTLLFTVEYVARILSVRRPARYVCSFFGVVDLLAIVSTYLTLLVAGSQSLIVIRALRLVRVFRVLKLGQYLTEARVLQSALVASRAKITVFLVSILSIAVIAGALLYLIEGSASGFDSIPRGV